MPFLMAVNGPEAGKQYELVQGESVLGRHPDCTIVVDVGAVSRHHCRISVSDSKCVIHDLKSRNGTFLNEESIQGASLLSDGDRVRICDVIFKFDSTGDFESSISESSSRAVMVEDEVEQSGSTIMSKLDVVAGDSGANLTASAEAKLDALIEIMQSLGKALSLDEVLPQVLDSLFRIFVQADRGFIGLVGEGGRLIPRWTKLRHDEGGTIRISRTIANQVLATKEAILSSDVANDERFEMSQSIADFRIRSMMCAPLVDGEKKVLGMLQIDTMDQQQRFLEQDLALLVSAAGQASIAIDNAQLHDEALNQQALACDLQLARDVQQAFLPHEPPDVPNYDFFDYYQAANQIGGDYYDYLWLTDGRLAVVVADVVGHGVAAAMLMAKLSAEARFCLLSESTPASAITKLNARVCRLNLDRFVTLILVVIDLQAHQATVVNAGHMPPFYRRADGSEEDLGAAESGVPIGILEDTEYDQASTVLALGESLTLFTDGISEAMNPAGEQYGMDRMRTLLAESDGSPKSYGEGLLDNVRKHLEGRPQDDDMCLVVLRRMP